MRPTPKDPEEGRRWEATALRERLLGDAWRRDLDQRLTVFYSRETLARMQFGDESRNPFAEVVDKINVAYDIPPTVMADGASPEGLPLIASEALWATRQDGHRLTLGCHESLTRLDWEAGAVPLSGSPITHRVVSAAAVIAEADSRAPSVPVCVRELRERRRGDRCIWTWEVWDVRDRGAPIFRIEEITDGGDSVDVTPEFWRAPEGTPAERAAYPYWTRNGRPILPYVLHHLQIGPRLWRPMVWTSMVECTLNAACLWTFWLFGVRDHSSPVRISLDIEWPGESTPDGSRVVMDQGAILPGRSAKGDRPGQMITLESAMDPERTAAAIDTYIRGAVQGSGIDGIDLQTGSAKGISGYAIVVSREGIRKLQRRYEPALREGDRQVLATGAALLNAYGDGATDAVYDLPEVPAQYSIEYVGVPRTLEEVRSKLEAIKLQREAGLISRLDAIRELWPHLTEAAAKAKWAAIQLEEAANQGTGVADAANALGVLVRAGAIPTAAAAAVGLPGLTFSGAVPVSLRPPDQVAAEIEALKG